MIAADTSSGSPAPLAPAAGVAAAPTRVFKQTVSAASLRRASTPDKKCLTRAASADNCSGSPAPLAAAAGVAAAPTRLLKQVVSVASLQRASTPDKSCLTRAASARIVSPRVANASTTKPTRASTREREKVVDKALGVGTVAQTPRVVIRAANTRTLSPQPASGGTKTPATARARHTTTSAPKPQETKAADKKPAVTGAIAPHGSAKALSSARASQQAAKARPTAGARASTRQRVKAEGKTPGLVVGAATLTPRGDTRTRRAGTIAQAGSASAGSQTKARVLRASRNGYFYWEVPCYWDTRTSPRMALAEITTNTMAPVVIDTKTTTNTMAPSDAANVVSPMEAEMNASFESPRLAPLSPLSPLSP